MTKIPMSALDHFKPSRRVEQTGTGYTVYVKPPSMFGLPEVSLALTADQYRRYEQWQAKQGMIQDLLPELNASQRELLMSGLGDADFDRMASGTGRHGDDS